MNTESAQETLHTSADVLDFILEHARGCLPNECCGLLLGHGHFVDKAWPARNEDASPTRYRVDPRDYIAAARYGRQHRLEVMGAYHSHPSALPIPSRADLMESAGESFVYVIAGPIGASTPAAVRAYYLHAGNFRELSIVTGTEENST